jgi:hypothetical protein
MNRRYHNSPQAPRTSTGSRKFPLSLDTKIILILLSPVWLPMMAFFRLRHAILVWMERRGLGRQRQPARKRFAPKFDPELERRRTVARTAQTGPFLHDPIEDDPAFVGAVKYAQRQADKEIGARAMLGRRTLVWMRKRQILKQDFGIDWYSPAQISGCTILD